MNCYELGGACNEGFYVRSFKEMAELSRNHALKMLQSGDQDHLRVMKELMDSPKAMQAWMKEKEELFNSLEDID